MPVEDHFTIVLDDYDDTTKTTITTDDDDENVSYFPSSSTTNTNASNNMAASSSTLAGSGASSIVSELSQKRQQVMDEIQRVIKMRSLTTNPNVKASCDERLEHLKTALINLNRQQQPATTTAANNSIGYHHRRRTAAPAAQLSQIPTVEEDNTLIHIADEGNLQPTRAKVQNAPPTPTGRWKSSILGFLKYGPFHPTILLSMFFPYLALSQVMIRLDLEFIAIPGRSNHTKDTFRIALVAEMVWVTINCLIYYLPIRLIQLVFFGVVNAVVFGYLLLNVIRVRRKVRLRYQISTRTSHEDTICSLLLSLLVIMQLLRQTADYDTYSASCFSSNGLPAHVPLQIPPPPPDDENTLVEPLYGMM